MYEGQLFQLDGVDDGYVRQGQGDRGGGRTDARAKLRVDELLIGFRRLAHDSPREAAKLLAQFLDEPSVSREVDRVCSSRQ